MLMANRGDDCNDDGTIDCLNQGSLRHMFILQMLRLMRMHVLAMGIQVVSQHLCATFLCRIGHGCCFIVCVPEADVCFIRRVWKTWRAR